METRAMEPRIDYRKFRPEPMQALRAMEDYIAGCGLEPRLVHLLKLRASQINGCAYCIDMHSIDARAAGETEQRLYALDAWRETPFFDERERAALAWTEALTLVAQTHVPDATYQTVREHFSEQEVVDLTYIAATINVWNRLAIALRSVPGRYRAAAVKEAKAATTAASESTATIA
jgi:AhpD family alkylhydroperoxidase